MSAAKVFSPQSTRKKSSANEKSPIGRSAAKDVLSGSKKRKTETQVSFLQATQLRVKLLSETAVAPKRGSAGAAGYDISSSEECVIAPRSRKLVKTDIALALPEGTYGRIAPRSGLAVRSGIDVGAGVIDVDYRGPLQVLLFNHTEEEFKGASLSVYHYAIVEHQRLVNCGDRIAQLVIEVIRTPEVAIVNELDTTERGESGFGSTGIATDVTNTIENKNAEAP